MIKNTQVLTKYLEYLEYQRRKIIERGLTREEAKRVVRRYPNVSGSMVVLDKQFYADKYFK